MSEIKARKNKKPLKRPLLQIKILYWGPGESGKTTNFKRIIEYFAEHRISNGFSIDTTDKRTLWNDSVFFEFELNKLNTDMVVNVSTTTGQERFLSTREYILQNTDGVIFVADSNLDKMELNKRSFEELINFTRENNVPILIELNKRDLEKAVSVKQFKKQMGLPDSDRDKFGFKVVYLSEATNRKHSIDLQLIFVEMIQKILRNKLVKN